MSRTFFDDDPTVALKNRAIGYSRRPDGTYHRLMMNSNTVGPWGLTTSVDDLLRWDENFRNNTLPSGPRLNEFFTLGSVLDNEDCLSAFSHQKYKGLKRIWYTGGGPGFLAHYVRFPEQDFSVVLLSNRCDDKDWIDMVRLVGQIADLYLADKIQPTAADDNSWNDNAPIVQLAELDLANKSGAYQRNDGFFTRLDLRDGKLVLVEINRPFPRKVPLPLNPTNTTRFRVARDYNPFDVIFDLASNGDRPSARVEYQNGLTDTWKPVEFATLNDAQLAEYVGEYYCDDLESVYRFSVDDGTLFVQFNFGKKQRLAPAVADVFFPATGEWDNMLFTFSRDPSGRPDGFNLEFDRIKRLTFSRRR